MKIKLSDTRLLIQKIAEALKHLKYEVEVECFADGNFDAMFHLEIDGQKEKAIIATTFYVQAETNTCQFLDSKENNSYQDFDSLAFVSDLLARACKDNLEVKP